MSIRRKGKPAKGAALPIFFSKPVILTAEQHSEAKFLRDKLPAAIHSTRIIPLVLADIAEAAKHYPIVLTCGAAPSITIWQK